MLPSTNKRYKTGVWPLCKLWGSALLAASSIIGTYYSVKSYYSPPSTVSTSEATRGGGASLEPSDTPLRDSNTFTLDVGTKFSTKSGNSEAELEIKRVSDKWDINGEQVHVHGVALYGTNPELHTGPPHIGELDFVAKIENGNIKYSQDLGKGRFYKIRLTIAGDNLEVTEEYVPEYAPVMFGLNVSFSGTYRKVGIIKEIKPL